MLSAAELNELFMSCLHTDEEMKGKTKEEMIADSVCVRGLTMTTGFHPQRLEAARPKVQEMIKELDPKFKEGWTFLNLPVDKDGNQWGEHRNAEQLVLLGIGLKLMDYCMPREFWPMLPGGVPYVQVF